MTNKRQPSKSARKAALDIPPGWGSAPTRAPVSPSLNETDRSRASVSGLLDAENRILRQFAESDCKVECGLFALSGDEVHLWRAWQAARRCGAVSPYALALLSPHFDQCAASHDMNPKRADQRELRNWALLAFTHELKRISEKMPGCAKDETEARKFVGAQLGVGEKVLKRWILDHEGICGRIKR